jgi:DNA-binding XRE family transcriptional regulator
MSTKQKSQLMRDAHSLYMSGHYTQNEIATRVGITRRTLYNWIQQGNWQMARQTAIVAPNLITRNFVSAIVELQNAIAQRPVGLRYPTAQETNTLSKLLSCISRMSSFPAEALQNAALTQHNLADAASLSPQSGQVTFIPYNGYGKMGKVSAESIDNQNDEQLSQGENEEQNEQDYNYTNWEENDNVENEPLEALGLTPDERKAALTQWLINEKLVPVGDHKIRNADGTSIRHLDEVELEFIQSYGYTDDDISNALTINLRA